MFFSVSFPIPRRFLKALSSFFDRDSNIDWQSFVQVYKKGRGKRPVPEAQLSLLKSAP